MKKLYSIILVICFFITSCSVNKSSIQGMITHAKFTDYYSVIAIDKMVYELRSSDHKTIKQFKEFYRDYHSKVTKQALTLHILTNTRMDFTYSFLIANDQLDKNTKLELETLYQAKLYQNQYMVVNFSARATPYYYGNGKEDIFVDKYKLEKQIPVLITEKTPFVQTGGGQTLLLLTMPIWVPFMILFGLKV
ncbi:hypothetical protein ACLSYX_04850 [[Pasteurella] aerogenes]